MTDKAGIPTEPRADVWLRERDPGIRIIAAEMAEYAGRVNVLWARALDVIAEYKAKIMAKIRSRIVLPPNIPDDSVAELDVTLLPGGDILNVRLRKSSGYAAFDSAVERAIFLAKPLPLPPDPALFPKFRELSLKVHYRE